jgi:hypothetical protein
MKKEINMRYSYLYPLTKQNLTNNKMESFIFHL